MKALTEKARPQHLTLTRAAGRGARVGSAVALAMVVGLVAAEAAMHGVDPISGPVGLSRFVEGVSVLIAGAVGWALVLSRGKREMPRRALALWLLAASFATVFWGQASQSLILAYGGHSVADWLPAFVMSIGAPLWIAGMVLLTWPPGMTRRDVTLVVLDSTAGVAAIVAFWLLALVPFLDSRQGEVVGQWDLWLALVMVVSVMVAATISRRSGALPIAQLIALQVSLLALAVGCLFRVATHGATGLVDPMVAALAISAVSFRRFAIRPAVEVEAPASLTTRHLWSGAVPILSGLLIAVALVASKAGGQATAPLLVVAMFAVLAILAANVVLRLIIARDMTRLQATKMAAPLSGGVAEHWFEAVLGDSRDVITVVDRDGSIVYQTPSAAALIGHPAGALNGKHVADLFPDVSRREFGEILLRASHDEADRGPHEFVLIDASDRRHDTETRVTPLRTDGLDGFVLTTNDVSDRRRLRAALVDSSVRDRLTGLPNREGFLARVREVVPAALPGTVAIALLDLNAFRALNDTRGHSAGDQVLKVVAAALERLPTAVTAVGRTGPDEFALLVAADPVGPDLGAAERALRESLLSVIIDEGRPVDVDFALGYAVKVDRAGAAGELLEHADLALAAARAGRSATPVAYRSEMRSALVSRLRAEADLRDALDSDRLLVYYQPIVSLPDQRLHGVEALARLRSPTGEIVGPAGFIEVAEELGLIGRLGLQVLSTALRDSRALSQAVGRPIPVSVNVSPRQVDDLLPDVVSDALRSAGVPAERLVLELTESLLAERHETIGAVLARIRGMGVAIALDDFGTGYSPLSYLAGLPVDLMKIDKSFVGRLGRSADSFALVRTLLQLAQNLGLATVAEGVETVEQADILRGMNCTRAQGYLFARPMTLADLLDLVALGDGRLPHADPNS